MGILACGNGIYSSNISAPTTIAVQTTATITPLWPTPTDTPMPTSTDIPLPTATNTLVTRPTETLQPTPTNTFTSTPAKPNNSTLAIPTGEGRIAFRSTRNDVWDIYAVNPDKSNLINMSNNSGRDWDFSWSPDGSRLAFISSRNDDDPEGCNSWCTAEIYTVNTNGDKLTRLTNTSAINRSPTWSPDGSHIAFASSRDETEPASCPIDCNFEIYVMNADGSEQIRLTNSEEVDLWPSWSPDGKYIAFTSYQDDNSEIYVMSADGSGQIRLTNNPARDFWPVWSPDGKHIAFISDRNYSDSECIFEQCQYDIFIIPVSENLGQGTITDDLVYLHPTNSFFVNLYTISWSPDSSKIVSHFITDESFEIFIINVDGSGKVYLTEDSGNDFAPVWSPDGTRIAFSSLRDGNAEIYIMDIDGSNLVRLTDNPANDFQPIWSP